jgi:hypothetical protein
MTPTEQALVRLEEPVPLSQSVLWRLHDEYFASAGIDAWASGAVPHQVTTGPALALSYAKIVEGFVADCLAGRFGSIDTNAPLFVLELGAGSGRFGFQFLKALRPEAVAPFRLVYVLSDKVEANVRFWSENGKFDEFLTAGRVDFARFAAGADSSIHLDKAGLDLEPGRVVNPMVAIANYFFDVLPQDLFAIVGDHLYEDLVSAHGSEVEAEATRDYLRAVRISLTRRRVGDHHYGDDRDRLLRQFTEDLPRDLVPDSANKSGSGKVASGRRFLFPSGAIQAITGLSRITSERMLVLAGERLPRDPVPVGDEGPDHLFNPASALWIGIHGGSISLPVNLAIVAGAPGQQPTALLKPRYPPTSLLVAAILVGERAQATSTRAAYVTAVDDLLPGAINQLLRITLRGAGQHVATLGDLLAILRLARFDPRTFEKCRSRLETLLANATNEMVDDTVETLRAVLEIDYPLTDSADLAGDIGDLLATAGRHDDARWFWDRSRPRGSEQTEAS